MKRFLPILLALCIPAMAQGPLQPINNPVFRAFDSNAKPLAGGKLFSYQAGTTTPLATYTDATGATPNTNPVILDSTGQARVFLGASAYKFILQNQFGVQQWSADNISSLTQISAGQVAGTALVANPTAPQSATNLNNFYQAGNGSGSIAAAFALAGPTGTVNIPKTNTETGPVTNTPSISYTDWRMGTTSAPTRNLSFNSSNLFMYSVDNSQNNGITCCGGRGPQGIGDFAPMVHLQLANVGSGTTGALYVEGDCADGCNAFHIPYALVSNAELGSSPQQVSGVILTEDNSGWNITSCNKVSATITCSLSNPINTRLLTSMVGSGIYVNGNSVANTGLSTGIISAATANNITFTTPNQTGTAGPVSGGHVGPNHLAWGLELNIFNNNHDPFSTSPTSNQSVNAFHGLTVTACCGAYPTSEVFYGGGLTYAGVRISNSIDGDFIAGEPRVGDGPVGTIGFVANPTQVATAGANFNSKSFILKDSVWNGSTFSESGMIISRKASSPTATNSTGQLNIDTPLTSYILTDGGQFRSPSGSASDPTYSFTSDTTSGVYRSSGGSVNVSVGGSDRILIGPTTSIPALAGSGNALVCVHSDGSLYRGTATTCP